MKFPNILGIDPGLKGAIALLDPIKNEILELHDMPTIKVKDKQKVQIYRLAEIIDSFCRTVNFVMLENVFAMPGQGVVSMFSFGESKGIVEGILASYALPIYFVTPGVWKMSMGLGKDKEASRLKAIELYPTSSVDLSRKKDEGRAEAILLAHFGKRFLK